MEYTEELIECMEGIDIDDTDCNTCLKMQETLNCDILPCQQHMANQFGNISAN